MKNASKYKGKISFEKDGESYLGERRVALLEAIETHGSISSAAKAVGMSYKGAWDMIDSMNNQSEKALVSRSVGGRHGGGTRLTEHGKMTLKLFREGEGQYQKVLDALSKGVENFDSFREILSRFSLRTSSRNQFVGKIARIKRGGVSADVRIRLDEENEIASVVTVDSAESLGLEAGMEVWALIKATSVMLSTDLEGRVSAENRLGGRISRIHEGEVNAEVMLALPSQKTVTSTLTLETVRRMGLKEGMPACALFQASSVILALIN